MITTIFLFFSRVDNFFSRSDKGGVSQEKQESNDCPYRSKVQKDENNANLLPRIISSCLVALNQT